MRQDVRETLEDEVIAISDVARIYQCNPTTIYRLIMERGIVDVVKVGGIFIMDKDDLDEIEAHFKRVQARKDKRVTS